MTKFYGFIFLLVFFTACDPPFSVMIDNKSGETKEVKIIEKDSVLFISRDSILIRRDSSGRYYSKNQMQQVSLKKNLQDQSFNFALGDSQYVVVQSGIGGPDWSQKIIIDNYDTINLRTDPRIKISRPWMALMVMVRLK